MHRTIIIEEAEKLPQPIYIDMRSPGEFAIGHILGAINIPLFSDKERIEVGTLYKKIGVEQAKELGLSIAAAKLPDIVAKIRDLYKTSRSVIIYCWRGGMRSKSIVTILKLMDIHVFQLLGGYKAYRRHILDSLVNFTIYPKIVVLCGSTGAGKTSLLQILEQKEIPVINLEKIANHRGSVFGNVGLGQPATAQFFDAALLTKLKSLNAQPYIIVECESKRIGNVYLPDCLYSAMSKGINILVHTDIETRISRLIDEYTDLDETTTDEILASLKTLKRRFGEKKVDKLLSDVKERNFHNVVHTLLTDYYDPLYGYETGDQSKYEFIVNSNDLELASVKIIDYLDELRR